LSGETKISFGNVPLENASMISSAALTPSWPPALTISFQRSPVGCASMAGSPASSFGKKPMLSE
jgi:hypothetical protein